MKKGIRLLTVVAAASMMTVGMATVCSAAINNGWKQEQTGRETVWRYYQNGRMMNNEWLQSGKNWYYLGDEGAMVTGWQEINNAVYYFEPSGVMATGWKKTTGNSISNGPAGGNTSGTNWYYFKDGGAMATGWQKINDKWYYFYDSNVYTDGFSDGQMLYGEINIDDKEYYFGAENDGVMKTGLVKVSTETTNYGPAGTSTKSNYYYYNADGTKKIDEWLNDNGKWYYFGEDGLMCTGRIATDYRGKKVDYEDSEAKYYYYLDNNTGVMKTGWVQVKAKDEVQTSPISGSSSDNFYQFYNSSGEMRLGWYNSGSKWYYLATDRDIRDDAQFSGYAMGQMSVGMKTIEGNTFYFNKNGDMASNTWKEVDNSWYYFQSNGVMRKSSSNDNLDVFKSGSYTYAVDSEGRMIVDTTIYQLKNGKYTLNKPADSDLKATYTVSRSGYVKKA